MCTSHIIMPITNFQPLCGGHGEALMPPTSGCEPRACTTCEILAEGLN